MRWYELILIVAGIGLDIFAAMEIEGAMVAKINMKKIWMTVFFVCLLELGFFFGGFSGGYVLATKTPMLNSQMEGMIIVVVIFALMGIRLLIKAIKRIQIHETRCENVKVSYYVRTIAVTSFYTIFAGLAAGLLDCNKIVSLLSVIGCSIAVVIGGVLTGYHYGFQNKAKLYAAGAVLQWAAGIAILIRGLVM